MNFDEHAASQFRDALQNADARVSKELGETHGREILRLFNHVATLTPEQCCNLWVILAEELALPRYMRE